MRKPLALLAALLLTTSLAAGCGDDGDGGDDASTNVEGGSASDSTDSTDVGADDSTTTTAGDATGETTGAGANPDSDFCDAARTFSTDQALTDPNLFQDPEKVAHGVDLLNALRDAAPEDLQDDVQVVIDGFQAVAAAMAEAGDDPAAQQAAVEGLQDSFEAISAASAAVSTYTQEQCGIDVTGTTTG